MRKTRTRARIGQTFQANLDQPLVVDGATAGQRVGIPSETRLSFTLKNDLQL